MPSSTESKTSKRILKGKEREAQAMALRLMGATYNDIGIAMDISTAGAYKAVLRAVRRLEAMSTESAAEWVRLELERLDKMQRNLWSQVTNGSHGAIDRVLRIMDHRAKLLGLYAPTKIAPTDPTGTESFDMTGWAIVRSQRLANVDQMEDRECASENA